MSVIISRIIWDKTHILKPQMNKIVEDDIHSTIFGLKADVYVLTFLEFKGTIAIIHPFLVS